MTEFDDGLKVTSRERETVQMIPNFLTYGNGQIWKPFAKTQKTGRKNAEWEWGVKSQGSKVQI